MHSRFWQPAQPPVHSSLNNEFLVQKAVKLLKDDPRTTLATGGETPAAVQEALEQMCIRDRLLAYRTGDPDWRMTLNPDWIAVPRQKKE